MNEPIPALSLRQPWLYAILFCGKTIENRNWATRYRGPLRLHAARTWDDDGYAWLLDHGCDCPSEFAMRHRGWLGAYLGEAELLKCVPVDNALKLLAPTWAFGPVCWILARPQAYAEPISGRGYPGLYYPERFERKGGDGRKR